MSDLGNKEIFAKNLKYYMEYHKKDRTQICKDLNIPYTTFNDWYNAVKYPRIDKIEILANYFNIKKSDLIENKYKDDLNELEKIEKMMHFSITLEELLKFNNISEREFADKINIGEDKVQKWLRQKELPDENELSLVCKYFNIVNIDDIFNGNTFRETIKKYSKTNLTEEDKKEILKQTLKDKGFLNENEEMTKEDFDRLIEFAKRNKDFIKKEP